MKRPLKILLTLTTALMIICLTRTTGSSQTITATLTGEIKDQAGAVVPGALVTATSVDTGQAKTATTNDDGNYTIPFLQPGTYNVTVEKSGFANQRRENIRLEIAQTASVDIDLGVTGSTVSVDVDSSETPILQTETSNLETTIEAKLIEDLPTADRNIFSFVNLVPGTIDTGAALPNNALSGPVGSSGNRNFFDSNFAVNGGRASSNDILLDGITNTLGDANGVAISPPQDAVREFKVVSGVAPAEYGRTGAGIVTIATKAGTRRFHGAIYEYFQDGNLNANGFRNNRNGIARLNSSSKQQFGGAVGGPLYFFNFGENDGGVARKIEKTFFFTNYELRREKNPATRIFTVPTALMRGGDLSELLIPSTPLVNETRNAAGQLLTSTQFSFAAGNPGGAVGAIVPFGQIFNPYTTQLVPYTATTTNTATGVRTTATVLGRPVFAGNNLGNLPVCPSVGIRPSAGCLDPVASAVLNFLPLPNRPGLVNNFAFAGNTDFKRDLVSGRIDHTVSEKQNFFGRFNYEKRNNAPPNFLGSIAAPVTVQNDTFFNATLNHVYSLTSTLINNFRYGYTRGHARVQANSLGFDPTALGLPGYLRDNATALVFPTFNIGTSGARGEPGAGIIGGAGNDQPRDTHMLADAMTLVKGSHTVKFGAEYRLYRFYPFAFGNLASTTGSFAFTRTATAGPSPSAAATDAAGSAFASFLLGIPSSINRDVQVPISIYHHYGAGYVQDDWKVTRKLTLNLGLRYDFETGTASPQRLITNFEFDTPSPVAGSVQTRLNGITLDPAVAALNPGIRNLTGRLSFPEGSQQNTNKDRFAPRVGFAYSLNDKTTVRGGYGLFFLPISLEGLSALGTSVTDPQIQTSFNSGQVTNSTIFLSNPFPGTLRTATGNTLGSLTALGSDLNAVVEPNRPNAYNMQWNLVLQRELAKNLVLDIAYVGSAGRNLPSRSLNLNQLSPAALDYARANFAQPNQCSNVALPTTPTGRVNLNIPCASVAAFLAQPVDNPLYLSIPGVGGLNGLTIPRAQLLRRFPQYQAVTQLSPNVGISNYHALQINLQKRFGNGFSLLTNYVFSKLLDTGGVGSGVRSSDATNAEDAFNLDDEYSYSTLDVPHRFTLSSTYELPFGKGKRFGKDSGKLVNFLIGGFQISGTGVYQTGTPLTITNSIGFPTSGLSGVGQLQLRPSRLPGINPMADGNFGDLVRQGLSVFNPAAFAPADTTNFRFGDAARTYNDIRRDNYKNIDLSIIKNISFNEDKQKLQLRGEFLNAFNTVVFGTPNLGFGSLTIPFGVVSSDNLLGSRPRIIQLVGRFTF